MLRQLYAFKPQVGMTAVHSKAVVLLSLIHCLLLLPLCCVVAVVVSLVLL